MDLDLDTSVMDLVTLDKALDKIESSIRTLLMTVQRIREARNRLIPIHRLPPELLVKIFNLVARPFVDKSSRRLLKITWVSRYWRDLALGSPNFWTVITNSNLAQTDEWITRSKECPISINIIKLPKNVAKVSIPHFIAILSQFHRLQHLRLTVTQSHLSWMAELVKENTAPLLTSLELERVLLPDGFLEKVPNVRVIYLRRCQHFWLNPIHFPNLTSLHIVYPRLPVQVKVLVESLNGMPQLERLVLVHALVKLPSDVLDTHPPLLGPRLSLLKVGTVADIETHLWFLQTLRPHCITPQTILSCSFDFSPFGNHTSLLPRLLSSSDQLLEKQAVTSIDYIFDIASDNHKPTISLNYRDIDPECGATGSPRSRFSIGIDIADRQTLLTTLQENLDLSHLQTARWCDTLSGALNPGEYMQVLGGLSKLEYLDIRVRREVITSLLQSAVPPPIAEVTTPPPFSALKTLQLSYDEQALPSIREFIHARKAANLPLETIIFSDKPDHLDSNAIEGFRDSISQLVYDDSPEAKLIEQKMVQGVESILDGCSLEPLTGDRY